MGKPRRIDPSAKQVAVVLIRGVLEEAVTLEDLADRRVMCRTNVVVDDAALDIVAFGRAAEQLNATLPGSPVTLVGSLRVHSKPRPDGQDAQVLTIVIHKVKSLGPSPNHRPFRGITS
jgi:single-stranded DNA-binding protein